MSDDINNYPPSIKNAMQILAAYEDVRTNAKPRCPLCGETEVIRTTCDEGSFHDRYDCNEDGYIDVCANKTCGLTIMAVKCSEQPED